MMNTGDIVRVIRNDNRVYDCFIVEDYKDMGLFVGRVLESSKDRVPRSTWSRYGLKNNCICQLKGECKSINLLSKSQKTRLEDASNTVIYSSKMPGTNTPITFCLNKDFGGWSSDDNKDMAILESFSASQNSQKETLENG